jgi:NAD(P)-dependent dehydrogenase (short-subunit alcohol dehydrogenase family)
VHETLAMTRTRPVTLVTGGSRGIGAATAVWLAEHGHDVALTYRVDGDAAAAVAERVRVAGGRCHVQRAEITDDRVVDGVVGEAEAVLGPLTGLVANAGLTAHLGDLVDTPVDVIRHVIDVNLTAVVLCARRAAQSMSTLRGGAGGAIVHVSSAAATLGSPHEYVHYAAAKAAVDALTLGLSKELAPAGIRVNAVAPGLVETRIHADAGDPDRLTRAVSRVPMGRAGQPDEIAAAVGWLLGPDAGYVTGTVVRVAGGL